VQLKANKHWLLTEPNKCTLPVSSSDMKLLCYVKGYLARLLLKYLHNHESDIQVFLYRGSWTLEVHCAHTHTHAHTRAHTHTHTHTGLTALFPGLPRWAGTRKVKPVWILWKQEAVSGSGISWAVCKSTPRSRQITMPAPHHSVFYRPDALPATQPTASKHWRYTACDCKTDSQMSSHTSTLLHRSR